MKDILGAMKEEELYLKQDESVYGSLRSRLEKYGYDNLDDYFEDKQAYRLKQIDFEIFYDEPTDGVDKRVWQAIRDKRNCIWLPKLEKVLACVGKHEFDYDLAAELGVGVLNMPHAGGTIITGPDDLTVGIHFVADRDLEFNYFFKRMAKYLKQFGIYPLGNDFMYDGKKVMGCSFNQTEHGMSTFFFSCTFTDHLDLIKKLCSKKSEKTPGFIPSNVLTKQQLLAEVLSWVNTQQRSDQ